ncbi:hypothetical protein LZ187_11615, partial [Rhodovulum sulfidophilum]|nr:hypothetical protein [Rhodovulum sulfidophilum]
MLPVGTVPAPYISAWRGGKKALHRQVVEQIEAFPQRTYVEPFPAWAAASCAGSSVQPLWVGCDHSLHRRGPLRAYSVEKPGSAIAFLLAQD